MSLDPMIIPMEVVSSDVVIPMEVATKYESPIELETLEVDHNEVYNSPSKKAWNKVIVDVAAPTGRKKIINNGIHDVLDYAEADVDVPNSYSALDEGKVVQNGELIGQTSRRIDSNGSYDTTVNNGVVIDVPNSYNASDEGKVVNNGELVPQTARTIVDNGTYDTTVNNNIIVNIESLTPPDENKPIRFYDYEGTLLYSYTYAEIQELTELPAQPVHDGLVATGWNWTLEDIIAENRPVLVGGQYRTSDGRHKIYITIISDYQRKLALVLIINGTIEVDWGDGTEADTITKSMTLAATPQPIFHEYDTIGDYCIAIKVVSGIISGAYSNYHILQYAYRPTLISSGETVSANVLIRKIEGGNNDVEFAWFRAFYLSGVETIAVPGKMWLLPNDGYNISFSSGKNLRFITIPNGVKSNVFVDKLRELRNISLPKSMESCSFIDCNALVDLVCPNMMKTVDVSKCIALRSIDLPAGLTSLTGGNNCPSLRNINLPTSITAIAANMFQNGYSLQKIDMPPKLTSIGNSAFANCNAMTAFKIPHLVRTIGNSSFANNKNVVEYDFTEWTNSDLDACTFGTNIFQNLTADTAILFKYKSVADHAATVTNLSTYASYFAYEEDDT